jgi:hypothetical protein
MATPHAQRYREKARELYKAAALAASDELRKDFARLARQYEQLALTIENWGVPEPPIPA